MNDATIAQTVLFPDLADRPLTVTFDQPRAGSDGGAILLQAADRRLGLLAALSATVPDARAATRVTLRVGDLLAQRVYAIACGHPDGNDADRLAEDPIHKLLLGRDPIAGGRLASQPTISRFEQTAAPRMLLAMNEVLADTVIARHRRRRHGGRGEPAASVAAETLAGVSARQAPGAARCRLRHPEIFVQLEAAGVEYVVAMASNAVRARHAEAALAPLRPVVTATQETATAYAEAAYQARSWDAPRRTIIKAEVVAHPGRAPRDNPRFVITNLRQTPAWIYTHVYAARGDSENRFKELKLALAVGRTSCTRFWANQLRVTLTAAAFVLFQELQLRADRTALRGAQVPWLRQALITIGVRVVRSVRRLVLHFPRSHPDADAWAQIARTLGAVFT